MTPEGFLHQIPDIDPAETAEWVDALAAVADQRGKNRVEYLVGRLLEQARHLGIATYSPVATPYINTISPDEQPWYPGDEQLEKRIRRFIRWNAVAMVVKANKVADGIGGHLSTFASSAGLYDVGFNHFFRGKDDGGAGDHIYIQGHAAPGIYSRAFVEGRLDAEQLAGFRREIGGAGLASYPHPRLMPDFWEFPTVSMGLGPLNSIYHARFNKYLHHRRIDDSSGSRVWCFIGDGECDEPETLAGLSLAGREQLDNLTWVVNCNLQRLDGPVRGNGKIIQELESIFRGAGWHVIKVIWGSKWDDLLEHDTDGLLVDQMDRTVDGQFQRYAVESGAYIREHFFGPDPRLRKLVENMTDAELENLPRGGHDVQKVYAAYKAATEISGQPTVILAKTVKGWALGEDVESRNATHQMKKLSTAQLTTLRDRLELGDVISDEQLEHDPPFVRPDAESPEATYLRDRRRALGGALPRRVVQVRRPMTLPPASTFAELLTGSGEQPVSTTTAFTRLLRNLSRDESVGNRIVPIVPDEARTFGMDSLFRELKIYAARGQQYEPVDHHLLLSYAEASDGQILEEGITEAGAMASWTAAATSYATRGVPMIPFFIFYSMFGFQRVGDLIWAAADARARGFLLGATAGRTTLLGEGLQHQDGHSLVLASTVPPCRAYDPAFSYELAIIVHDGIDSMYARGQDVFYYLTLYNEMYPMPAMPEGRTAAEIGRGVVEGLYKWMDAPTERHHATVLFSGSSWRAALDARSALLAEFYGIGIELWSATSYKALREEALATERWNRLHPADSPRLPLVTQKLLGAIGPVVAVSDYMRMVPDQISRWVPGRWLSLGTDGFGQSDTREQLRRHFETDTAHIVVAVLSQLCLEGIVTPNVVSDAIARYGIDPDSVPPWSI